MSTRGSAVRHGCVSPVRLRIFSSVLLGLLGLAFSANSLATATLDAAIVAFRKQDLRTAQSLFLQAYAAGERGAKLSYNLGVVHYKLADYAAAEIYFAEAEQYPQSKQIAQYNLARCAEQREDADLAMQWYAVAAKGEDLRVADLASRAKAKLIALSDTRMRYGGFAGFGIDSGVVGLVDQVTSLPTNTPDTYSEISGYWGYEDLDVGGGAWLNEINAYAISHDDVHQANVQSIGGRSRWENQRDSYWRYGVQWGAGYEWLDAQSYQLRAALQFDYGHAWQGRWVKYLLNVEWVDARSQFVPGIEGWRADAQAALHQRWLHGVLGTRLIAQYNDREAEAQSPYRYGLELFWRGQVTSLWEVTPGIQWRQSDYPTALLGAEQRTRVFIRIDEAGPSSSWKPRIEVIYERNRSDAEARAYEHMRLSLGLNFGA